MVPRWHRRSKPGLWDRHATILGATSEHTCFGLWNMTLKFQSQGIFVHLWYYDSLKFLRTSCAPRFVGGGVGENFKRHRKCGQTDRQSFVLSDYVRMCNICAHTTLKYTDNIPQEATLLVIQSILPNSGHVHNLLSIRELVCHEYVRLGILERGKGIKYPT